MDLKFKRNKKFDNNKMDRLLKEEIKEYINYECTQKEDIKTIILFFKGDMEYMTIRRIKEIMND